MIDLPEEDLVVRLSLSPKPVRRLKSNVCPIIMSMEEAPAIATAAQLGIEELTRRTEFLRGHEEFCARLASAFQSAKEEPIASRHLERQLYDGFFPKEDEPLVERFHLVPWEERLAIINAFKDRRLKKVGQRLIYLERPDLLPVSERSQYDRAIAIRIGTNDGEVPWLTLPKVLADLDNLFAEADPFEVAVLQDHGVHLSSRLDQAMLAVGGQMIPANLDSGLVINPHPLPRTSDSR